MHLGRAHTAGDIVAWVPDAERGVLRRHRRVQVGLLLRRRAFHRLAGDARRASPAFRPSALVPGRGDALVGADTVAEGIALTARLPRDTYRPGARGRRARRLAEGGASTLPRRPCDPKYANFADLRALPAVQRRARLRRGAAASTSRASGPPSATGRCGPRCRAETRDGRATSTQPLSLHAAAGHERPTPDADGR